MFQEDGQVHNRHLENAPIAQERREKPQALQPPVLRKSTQESRALDKYVPSLDYVMLTNCKDPSYYNKAMLGDDNLKLERAMQLEMELVHKNATWDLV